MSRKFSLVEHPWLFLLAYIVTTLICNVFFGTLLIVVLKMPRDGLITVFWYTLLSHLLTLFIIIPFALGFPGRSRSYASYLSEIRLSRLRPLLGLILLGASCYLILGLCQAAGVLVYRWTQGLPVDMNFMRSAFVLANELPPRSMSWLQSLPSIFEEVAFRGVILALFLRYHDRPRAILFSALSFGFMHALNMLNGTDLLWVAGQVVWAAILGLFYGYVTLKSGSLLPAMLVHYLGNLLIGALNAYIQNNAGMGVQAVYGIIFTLGLIPTGLMILWTRAFTTLWPMPQAQADPYSISRVQSAA